MINFKIDLMSKNIDELIKEYNNRPSEIMSKIYILAFLDDFIMLDNEVCDKLIALTNVAKEYFNGLPVLKDCEEVIIKLKEEKKKSLSGNLNRIDIQIESLLKEINMYVSSDYIYFSKKRLDDILKSLIFIERVHINMENTRNDLDPLFRYINRKSFERKYDKTIKNFDKRLENEKILIKSK